MRGSLNYMLNESIGRSIGKLAASLGQRTYAAEVPAKFLKRCYTLRSRLVHGTELPDWMEVSVRNAELERLVGDLIAVDLLSKFDAEPGQTYIGAAIAPDWNGDGTSVPFVPIALQFGASDDAEPESLPS